MGKNWPILETCKFIHAISDLATVFPSVDSAELSQKRKCKSALNLDFKLGLAVF